jgi:N-acetylglucosamine kinase-like BadF-type ATPase
MEYDFEQFVEAFEFLDALRESGETNMFGASSYVISDLGHDRATARNLVSAWMKSYDGVSSVEDRAKSFENNS